MADPRTDDDLMLAYAKGDPKAFEVLYERYRRPLYRYLFHAVADRALADDLYQEVWSRIINAREQFRRGAGFKRYAFRIAHNRLVDHWRTQSRRGDEQTLDEAVLPAPDHHQPDQVNERSQQGRLLQAALAELSNEQREAFLLQQEAGLTLADIAKQSGVGRETVKSRLRYALQRLRTRLSANPEAAKP
jgi:RNA polymerase sigma-70 factor (ECF subfamily)